MLTKSKNIEFKEVVFNEDLKSDVEVFQLKEPSHDEWNKKARKQNIKMFIEINNRIPKDYNEVLTWIYSPEKEENHIAANDMAFI